MSDSGPTWRLVQGTEWTRVDASKVSGTDCVEPIISDGRIPQFHCTRRRASRNSQRILWRIFQSELDCGPSVVVDVHHSLSRMTNGCWAAAMGPEVPDEVNPGKNTSLGGVLFRRFNSACCAPPLFGCTPAKLEPSLISEQVLILLGFHLAKKT